MTIEPPAVRRVAEVHDAEALARLAQVLDDLRKAAGDFEAFATTSATFHRELVRLSGNHTLSAVVQLLTEIGTRHMTRGADENHRTAEEHRDNEKRAIRSYERLHSLLREGRAVDAEAFWRRHMQAAAAFFQSPGATRQVLDVLR